MLQMTFDVKFNGAQGNSVIIILILTVWHNVDLPAEVGDGPGEVMVNIIFLI